MNSITLSGYLTNNAEIQMLNNRKLAKFTLAVEREFSKEKETDFFDCVCWEGLADYVENGLQNGYYLKGCFVEVKGAIVRPAYNSKNGNQKRYGLEVRCSLTKSHRHKSFEENGNQDNSGQPYGNSSQNNSYYGNQNNGGSPYGNGGPQNNSYSSTNYGNQGNGGQRYNNGNQNNGGQPYGNGGPQNNGYYGNQGNGGQGYNNGSQANGGQPYGNGGRSYNNGYNG